MACIYVNLDWEGLALCGLSSIVTNYPKVCQPLSVQGKLQDADATYLFRLMSPEYSQAGSSRREVEETLIDNFQDFLLALEDGNITVYEWAVAWNYSENDIEIPESQSQWITSATILGWFTGQKHWLLNGEKIQITVKFDHDCVVRNPTNSICFLLLGASAMEVTFPVSHMKTYDDFKNVFILAFFIGQVFGKPGDK